MKYSCLAVFLFACTSSSDDTTSVTGQAVYRDAATDHQGTSSAPAAPPAQDAKLTVTVKGTGDIPHLDPQCALDTAGVFEARSSGTLALAGDHAYASSLTRASSSLTTPSGCAIDDLTVGVVTDVVIRGELAITTQNCDTYCAASARADAEAQCGATPNAAACRADAETQAQAACTTQCTTQAHAIVAEVSLGASALGDVDADALRAVAFGDLSAQLVFDELEE